MSTIILKFLFRRSVYFTRAVSYMAEHKEYEHAVEALNTLQTSAQILDEMRKKDRKNTAEKFAEKFVETPFYLNRLGIQVVDLNRLNAVHVAGTKGKGSVCAMCESILRAHGYKTGFLSSPHLLEVRERIRINGTPLSKDMFVNYFWKCYNMFEKTKDSHNGKMPSYPRFMTLMAFKVFLEEKVDVAVVEVGMGGSYDPTNVINLPKVCAVASLGYDHTDILGTTIKEIAWYKAGIFKPGVPAFTVPQKDEGLEMIRDRAKELNVSSVMISPDSSSYTGTIWELGIAGSHQYENASLACQVCRQWLIEMQHSSFEIELVKLSETRPHKLLAVEPQIDHHGLGLKNGDTNNELVITNGITNEIESDDRQSVIKKSNHESHDKRHVCGIPVAEPFNLPPLFLQGLRECHWPGRCQVINRGGVSYFLDGAHTPRSVLMCSQWFEAASKREAMEIKDIEVVRILLFNFSGRRKAELLINPLLCLKFCHALFCPNIAGVTSSDQSNYAITLEGQLQRCHNNAALWKELNDSGHHTGMTTFINEPSVFESISEAIDWVDRNKSSNTHIQVLVCGSLHLVGGVMKVLGCTTDTI